MTDEDGTDLQLRQRPVTRRGALALLGGLGLLAAGCSGGSDGSSATATTSGSNGASASGATTTTTGSAAAAVTSCSAIPEETGGPYPGDGSNGPDVLSESGVVRKDIRTSFDGASGTAEGVPYTIQFTVVDVDQGCTPLEGAAVYVWHCDRGGDYSMYQSASDANYLRGVQPADKNGLVTFTSIFPAAYDGRWPHVHFEVYPSVDAATSGGTKLVTSQIALPQDVCEAVYATSGYEQAATNLARTSLATDMVFSDGVSLQTPSMTGNVTSGYVSSLVVGVSGTV
ncbi:MAG TPA: intradiol ring-cleavage dioxygenase [Acidimicrobiia bacterium]|jgi:protocatechuate 3,4-dioxygenase beta subunit